MQNIICFNFKFYFYQVHAEIYQQINRVQKELKYNYKHYSESHGLDKGFKMGIYF